MIFERWSKIKVEQSKEKQKKKVCWNYTNTKRGTTLNYLKNDQPYRIGAHYFWWSNLPSLMFAQPLQSAYQKKNFF